MTLSPLRATHLAINGGPPLRSRQRSWPSWPVPAADAERFVSSVLRSGRWAISSPSGGQLYERRFADMFADYVGVRHCVPVDHGSSALVIALEALGLDFGDTVLVPALTWTASATAAFRAGLVPVLVDVDEVTGCIGPENVDLAVGARALVAVHWANAMANIPAILDVAEPRGIAVIEDCAQAHGARWQGRAAGSMGRLGCFSFQHGKVLTGGEGGAVVTDDDGLALKLEELRADSRSYRRGAAVPGELDLVETASIQGVNFCMSEFSAAVLCAQLGDLEAQHDIRNRNHAYLAELLTDLPSVRLLAPAPQQTSMSIYEATIIFDELPGAMSNADVAAALSAELGVRFYITDTPLHRSQLLQPWTKSTLRPLTDRFIELHRDRAYPHTDFLASHSVQTHHSTFLGDESDMEDIAASVAKVVNAAGR